MEAGSACPNCAETVPPGETTCRACGYNLERAPDDGLEVKTLAPDDARAEERKRHLSAVRWGQRAVLGVAILWLIGGSAAYGLAGIALSDELRAVERERQDFWRGDRARADAREREAKRVHGIMVGVAAGFAGGAVLFFGLWLWSKAQPLGGLLTALILFAGAGVTIFILKSLRGAQGARDAVSGCGSVTTLVILAFLCVGVHGAWKLRKIRRG